MVLNKISFAKTIAKFFSSFGCVYAAKLFKLSCVVGSTCAFFSGVNIAMPLVGVFGGMSITIPVFLSLCFIRYALFGASALHLLAYFVPGFFAAAYFAFPNIFTRFIVPALCIILFIAYTGGNISVLYAAFWIIPLGLYFVQSKHMFVHALASTFIAHAVGSVIWIYTMPMPPLVWVSLIPVVLLERIAFALGISLLYYAVMCIKKKTIHIWSVHKGCPRSTW